MPPHRPLDPAQRRRRIGVLALAAVTVFVVLALVAGGGSHKKTVSSRRTSGSGSASTVPGSPVATSAAATTAATAATSVPPTSAPAPTTTVDPGSLPQTKVLPSGTDPAFTARIDDLWQAIVTGNPALAQPAFFPLSAYVQVKGISDPVHDYQTRLIPDYDQDIATLHTEVGGGARLVGVSVPDTAEWILPGVEYNKGSYYRVYSTAVSYSVAGVDHTFYIASMISWRGEWYVVHLSSIR